ncbi:uncharacterized protein LOC121367929 [Gigantopelta aegis]|uniref:uncharacterized protein LOC121367929 n=1 Tax=Gigantopelta aegis TaxID=1735272 RepID=UPI001B88DC58|nr:uncharacterized protein LOC121367929 [Gigantopelta aegis]
MNVRNQIKRFKKEIIVAVLFYVILHVLVLSPVCMLGVVPLAYYPKYEGSAPEPAITIVTAYFNLGRFRKGNEGNVFGPGLYQTWASVYRYMENPVILYTDSDDFADVFTKIRSSLPNRTRVIRIERDDLWAFKWVQRIREIYSDPSYPKFHPNTVVPEYSCAQHAKYSCVQDAILKDFVKTDYVMWLDVGYFRLITERKRHFLLSVPPHFDNRRMAVNQIHFRSLNESPNEIFRTNLVWVAGGLVLGQKELFLKFIKTYRSAVERYLDMGLSSTDQQVLFAMYTQKEKDILKPVQLQPYVWDVFGSCWYYLGYQCYKEL